MSWLFDDEKDKKEKENSKSWFDGGYGMADDERQFYWDQHKYEGSDEPSGINIIMDKAQQIIQKFLPDVNCVSNTIGAAFESEGTQCNTYRAHLKSGTKCDVVLIKEGWSSLDLDDLVMHTTDGRAIARILEIDGSTTYRNENGVKYKLVELRPEK